MFRESSVEATTMALMVRTVPQDTSPARAVTHFTGSVPPFHATPRPDRSILWLETWSWRLMCPLRVILIFLSATVACFFLVRGSTPTNADDDTKGSPRAPVPLRFKVGSAVKTRFWTMVDMASGRYLWCTLVAQPAKSESEKAW